MQNKKTVWLVVGFVVVALLFFYVGDKYGSGKASTQVAQNASGFVGRTGAGGQRGARVGGGNVFGTIVSKDANSITVQLTNPGGPNATAGATNTGTGSKIVLYTGTTTVLKTATGTANDLVVGANVSVQGTANPDGSVSADSISIRPNVPLSPAKQ